MGLQRSVQTEYSPLQFASTLDGSSLTKKCDKRDDTVSMIGPHHVGYPEFVNVFPDLKNDLDNSHYPLLTTVAEHDRRPSDGTLPSRLRQASG